MCSDGWLHSARAQLAQHFRGSHATFLTNARYRSRSMLQLKLRHKFRLLLGSSVVYVFFLIGTRVT